MGGAVRVVAVVAMFLAAGAGAPRAAVILDSLVVRVYDNAGVLAGHRARAIKSAHEILARAEVAVEWHDCPAGGVRLRRDCAAVPAPEELSVRLVRSPRRTAGERALGNALIDNTTGRGTLATVFVDRVEAMAGQGRIDAWSMVGRVMAHEIGHLLLGTNSHSDAGVMREIWTLKDLIRDRPQDWVFSNIQRETLRNRVGPRATG